MHCDSVPRDNCSPAIIVFNARDFMLIRHSLCDASFDTSITCKDPLHTVDETALPHIRKT